MIAPKLFYYGDRKYNIIHTKLRHGCSQLNSDLHRVNLRQSPFCECGDFPEDANHFFFYCNTYNDVRRNFMPHLRSIMPYIDVEILLFGHSDLTSEENYNIVLLVLKFIRDSRRFN